MKKFILVCDNCSKEVILKTEGFVSSDLPPNWIAWGYHKGSFLDPHDWRVTHHFCCGECMGKAVKVIPNP